MAEEWRAVEGHPNYEVSNMGRVRSWANGRWGRLEEPRILACTPTVWGYNRATLTSGKQELVHRLVLRAFVGPPPKGRPEGAHRNGVKTDNRLDNLYWASPKENGEDNARLGVLKGERHPHARLTEEQVRWIRREYVSRTISLREMARELGVSYTAVQRVASGQGWVHAV